MTYTLTEYKDAGPDPRGNHKLYAKFQEYEGGQTQVYWGVKNLPRIGDTFDGEITVGEYGPRFKRTFDQGAGFAPTTSNNGSAPNQSTPSFNGDGQKQGMAINNAAEYVKDWSLKEAKKLSPEDFKKAVTAYAIAIYGINLTNDFVSDMDLTAINSDKEFNEALLGQLGMTEEGIDGSTKNPSSN